jgi:hypothetical protein
MDNYRPTIIERAFILAGSGRFNRTSDVRQALKAEGYLDEGQLRGPSIAQQIRKLIQATTGKTKTELNSDPIAARAALAQRRARAKGI